MKQVNVLKAECKQTEESKYLNPGRATFTCPVSFSASSDFPIYSGMNASNRFEQRNPQMESVRGQ